MLQHLRLPRGHALLSNMSTPAGTRSPVTGGGAISAGTNGGASTSLTGPIYSEGASGDVGTGTMILRVPAGLGIEAVGTVPTVLMTRVCGERPVNTECSNRENKNWT